MLYLPKGLFLIPPLLFLLLLLLLFSSSSDFFSALVILSVSIKPGKASEPDSLYTPRPTSRPKVFSKSAEGVPSPYDATKLLSFRSLKKLVSPLGIYLFSYLYEILRRVKYLDL